jgi:hypothetical protein
MAPDCFFPGANVSATRPGHGNGSQSTRIGWDAEVFLGVAMALPVKLGGPMVPQGRDDSCRGAIAQGIFGQCGACRDAAESLEAQRAAADREKGERRPCRPRRRRSFSFCRRRVTFGGTTRGRSLTVAALTGPLKPQSAHAPDELGSCDRGEARHSRYLAGANLQPIDGRDIVVQGNSKEHPALESFSELVSAPFQRGVRGINAIEAGDFTVELPVVQQFVMRVIHGSGEVLAQHSIIIPRESQRLPQEKQPPAGAPG